MGRTYLDVSTVEAIVAAIEQARERWTGLSWTSPIAAIASELERVARAPASGGSPREEQARRKLRTWNGATWFRADGSEESSRHLTHVRHLQALAEASDTAVDVLSTWARVVADEEAANVAEAACRARGHGARAIALVREGRLEDALDELESARAEELLYDGDAVWSVPRRMVALALGPSAAASASPHPATSGNPAGPSRD